MTAIVTTPFRVVNAQNFKEDVASSSVYVAIGKSDVWSNSTSDTTDTTPFTPLDNIDNIAGAYQQMIGMKKVTAGEVSHIVPRHTWTSGRAYVGWDSDDATIYDKAFYIITSEFKVYKCIEAGAGASTIEPVHINTQPTAESDGYTAANHQREVGTGYFDKVAKVISGNDVSTLALKGSTEEEQF